MQGQKFLNCNWICYAFLPLSLRKHIYSNVFVEWVPQFSIIIFTLVCGRIRNNDLLKGSEISDSITWCGCICIVYRVRNFWTVTVWKFFYKQNLHPEILKLSVLPVAICTLMIQSAGLVYSSISSLYTSLLKSSPTPIIIFYCCCCGGEHIGPPW